MSKATVIFIIKRSVLQIYTKKIRLIFIIKHILKTYAIAVSILPSCKSVRLHLW